MSNVMRLLSARAGVWALLALSVAIGMLRFRSDSAILFSYSFAHLIFILLALGTLAVGTKAMFGIPDRKLDRLFLILSLALAGFFACKNIVLRFDIAFGDVAVLVLAAVALFWFYRVKAAAALDGSLRNASRVALVNAGLFLALLFLAEVFARAFLGGLDPEQANNTKYGNPFWFQFQPFLMFSMDKNVDITFKNGRLPGDQELGTLQTNNMGFRMAEPVEFDRIRKKQPGERVVLFTGGSAAWGAGATSNETTIAARLEQILNSSQQSYRYVVISLSSGGWIAMQSVLALVVYGPNYDPDWVVSMDGNNDIVAACAEGLGAGRDGFSSQYDQYFRSYLYRQPKPPFYRGEWDNNLVWTSLLYRLLTQKRYVPQPVSYTSDWGAVERSLSFYAVSYQRLFRFLAGSNVKMLLSSQPYKNLYANDFEAEPQKLQDIANRFKDVPCESVPHLELMRYFHPRLRAVSQGLIQAWQSKLDIRYLDMTALMPEDPDIRLSFSWGGSPVHLSDRGQDYVAQIYARVILDTDAKQKP